MRESRTYGSVRGARGNSRPYRERIGLLHCISLLVARSAASNWAERCPLCPDTSDFDLLSDGERWVLPDA